MSELLRAEGLGCTFRLPGGRALQAVDEVSFTLARGEVLGLVGESGSGKSTLGKLVTGLLPRSAGTVVFEGETQPVQPTAADFRRRRGRLQMVFQDPAGALNPVLTLAQTLAEPLRLLGVPACEHAARVDEWLERVGLRPAQRARFPHELSGGQRQRAGIARALITQPALVVCDEPIAALDVSIQAQVVNLLGDLRRELGLALLFIGHDLAMVQHLADRIAVMQRGRIVECGPADAVCDAPAHPYTRALLAARLAPPASAAMGETTPA